MKKVAPILFAMLMALWIACNDEGKDTDTLFDKNLLLDKKWSLKGGLITENGQASPMTIDTCRMDNLLELRSNNHLICYYGLLKCNPNEPDTLQKWWHIIDEQLDLDNLFYDVVFLSADSMSLKTDTRFEMGMVGDGIELYYKN